MKAQTDNLLTAVIVDDEAHCSDLLRLMLERHCPLVRVEGIFNDPTKALEAVRVEPPQLLFLDIEMPRLNGFDLLESLGPLPMRVIFTTAYDQYALKAFKFNALDYLLKPIDKDELMATLARVHESATVSQDRVRAARLLRDQPTPERIALPVGQELVFVEVADILYGESDGSYVTLHVHGHAKPILLSKSLRELEELLNNPGFFRAHNSYLVQLRHVSKILRADGGGMVMRNGAAVPVARAKKQELLGLIAKL
jgi:two-component system LytT family response regulator